MSNALTAAVNGLPLNVGMPKNDSPKQDLSTFAERLRFAIDRKRANPNKIEVTTGITRQAIYAMLNGTTDKPTWASLVKLCDFLGVRPEWLAEGEAPMFPAPVFNDDEAELVEAFRQLSPPHQRDIAEIVKRWADEDSQAPGASGYRLPGNIRRQ